MLVIGMAAGFGGLFQTPLSATFFCNRGNRNRKMDYESTTASIGVCI